MKRTLLALAATLALLIPGPAPAAEPFTINVILSLTGYAAFIGQQEAVGLKAIEDVTNRSGGIRGVPVHFEVVDDASSPQNALQLANQIVSKGAQVILGPTLTSNCEAVFPRILENGPLTYCFSPALYPAAGTYGFSSGPSTRDYNITLFRYFRSKGWNRVALLTTTDASGQDGERQGLYAAGLAENKAMKIVANEHMAVTDLSIAAQIARMEAAKPDVVLAWITGTPAGTALRGFHNSGMNVPISLNAGDIVTKQIEGYRGFLPKTLIFPGLLYMAPDQTKNALVRNEQTRFIAALKAQNSPPLLTAALVYDPIRIVVEALRHEGPTATSAQLRSYIEKIKGFPGVNGIYNYTDGSQRGIGVNGVLVVQWDDEKDAFIPISKPGGLP